VLAIGEKERHGMKKKMEYTNAPTEIAESIETGDIVTDFLPPPDSLVRKDTKVKITISLNKRSVDFFKRYAKKNNVKYQTMINEVLDRYAQRFGE